MKWKLFPAIAAASVIGMMFNPQPTLALTTVEIVQKTKPAVVLIAKTFHGKLVGTATGFFITPNMLATNFHVIKGRFDKLEIVSLAGEVYTAKFLQLVCPQADWVVIETKESSQYWLTVTKNSPLEGAGITVIGNPIEEVGTVSTGIISAVRPSKNPLCPEFQFTAPVSQGSSGSPILIETGEVIGMVKAIDMRGQNLNFAVSGIELYCAQLNISGATETNDFDLLTYAVHDK
jgi:serine protease Do